MINNKRRLRKLTDEVWRDIPFTKGRYEVSNYGRIKSFAYEKKEGRVLKCSEVNGFKLVQLRKEDSRSKIYVHKIVAQVWLEKPSDDHTIVTHLDGNLKNNHVLNLEWHTKESLVEKHREYAKVRPQKARKRAVRNGKLKEEDVKVLKSMLNKGVVQSKIAKLFCISEMQVTRIKRGENWGHVQP